MAYDVVDVTRFSSQTPGAAERRGAGPHHSNLLIRLLIGCFESIGRFHWTLSDLELHPQTQTLRSAAPRLRVQAPLLQEVHALHHNTDGAHGDMLTQANRASG